VRAQLFLSSYAPLFLILAIRFDGTVLRLACAVLAAIGLTYLLVVVVIAPTRAQPRPYPALHNEPGSVITQRSR